MDIQIFLGEKKENVSVSNIYSKFNAVITDINIYAGNTNLKVGDLVKEGDLLIENNNGASGKILGKVYYTDCLIYNENQVIENKTGRFIETSDVLLFNKKLHKRIKNIEFMNYIEENCVFCVSKNNFLPISLLKTKLKISILLSMNQWKRK